LAGASEATTASTTPPRTLRKLYEDRNDVDYGLLPANEDEAREGDRRADRLVNGMGRWLDRHAKPRRA
jgi:hypothetical protein